MHLGEDVLRPDAGPSADDVLDALPVAVLVIGPDSRIMQANAAAERMLNRSERMMQDQDVADMLPDLAAAKLDGDYTLYDASISVAGGNSIRVDLVEAKVPAHHGWRTLSLHPCVPSFNHAERGSATLAASGAASMLAHEIRNPLSGIRGAAQLLGRGDLTQLIVTEVDRIAALIDSMQQFGDTRQLVLSDENIYPLIFHACALAKAGFARDLPIEEHFDPSIPSAMVNGDALLQVLINLLKNASEAVCGVTSPRIRITTAYRQGMTRTQNVGTSRIALPIEISVRDNGAGVPPELVEHMFDPFVSGNPEGQGLGLALVQKLMGDLGGIVQHERGDEWTIFRILLPRAIA